MKYGHLLIEKTNPPASDAEIESIEHALGMSLPDDYRAFLQSCNGGYLEYDVLLSVDGGEPEYLSFPSLYKAGCHDEWETIPFELVQAKKQQGFPQAGVLPIAGDGGSNTLYLDLRAGYKVVAHVTGLPEWTGLRQESALVEVADSFADYLKKLTISDEVIRDHIDSFEVSEASVAATLAWFDSIGLEWRETFREAWNERVPFQSI